MFLPSTIDKNIMLTKRVEKVYQYYKDEGNLKNLLIFMIEDFMQVPINEKELINLKKGYQSWLSIE